MDIERFKRSELRPLLFAKTVARVLVEQVFCRLGTQIALLTDNAGELDGHLMQEICRLLEIDKQHTSFYHPETNSVAERFHGTLNSMMGSEHQRDFHMSWPLIELRYISPQVIVQTI